MTGNVVLLAFGAAGTEGLPVLGPTPGRAAQQAAQALRPLTGPLAGLLFAAGILGTGLLAVLP